MRTRCPQCHTIFRVTSEQLRARGGKVRCGHCQAIFNALDSLIEEGKAPAPLPEQVPAPVEPERFTLAAVPPAEPFPPAESVEPTEPTAPAASLPLPEPEAGAPPASVPGSPSPYPADPLRREPVFAEPVSEPSVATDTVPEAAERQDPLGQNGDEIAHDETPEETTEAARAAGLVAARELTETPGYNRWAAGTLAGSPLGGLGGEHRHGVRWPFVAAAVLLGVGLLLQLAYHFRTEIVQRAPDAAAIYNGLGINVPLPRVADLVSIESSDLQADNSRDLLVLQATLKNRAQYAQAWPALELTLTDARDTVVARRVLTAADYLPPKTDPDAFAANSEIAIRLWIDAKDVAATGYRLYVFYP